jgi:hypothetical protein
MILPRSVIRQARVRSGRGVRGSCEAVMKGRGSNICCSFQGGRWARSVWCSL